MTLAAAVLLAAAIGLAFPARPRVLRPRWNGWSGRVPGALVLVGAAGLTCLVLAGLPAPRIVLVAILLASGADLLRRERLRRARAGARERTASVMATCDAIAADLRSGLPAVTALGAAASSWSEFAPVAHAARLGADVPDAMRALSRLPGAAPLRVVAAAWQVSHRSGAGLASALGMAARVLREERATAEVVATEMAAARATAVMLAVLPIGVLVLGAGLGGDPFGFLLGTMPGLACLATGLALIHAGLAWLDAIATSVQR